MPSTSNMSIRRVDFADRIYHVDCKDTRLRERDGRVGRLGSHLAWGNPRRGWDFVSAGQGDVPFEDAFRALESIGYAGPISIEWEDSGMSRLEGGPRALAYVRSLLWEKPQAAFDTPSSNRRPESPRLPPRRRARTLRTG